MQAYPSSVWRDRQSDTPIRTIKTIIHTLVRLQGDAVLSHLETIDNLKESELEPYLQKLLKSGVSKEKDATTNSKAPDPQVPVAPEKKDGSTRTRRMSKATQETLTAIFRKIGSKEQSQEVRKGLSCFSTTVIFIFHFLNVGIGSTVRFQATVSGCGYRTFSESVVGFL